MNEKSPDDRLVLLTGATGYVGGRLLTILEDKGYRLRCLTRHRENLTQRVGERTEIAAGDIMDKDSLIAALRGVHTAYYLIHSMGSDKDFEEMDRKGATNFAAAAKECGVQRIIYLGGLGDSAVDLSAHLRSRQEVGRILANSGVQTIELRASIVIGSGSLSFEMIRALVERLPVMITPRWVSVKAQPIAVTDLLAYLVQALETDISESRIFEIGGTDRVSYGDLMQEYARQRGLRRLMIPVPVLSPRLSSLWLGLVTPLYARIGRKLVDSLRHETVVLDRSAESAFDIRVKGVQEAIAEALDNEDHEIAQTRWSDAVSSSGPEKNWGGVRFRSRLIDQRQRSTPVPPSAAFKPIQRIGGEAGWYYANWLWKLRGFIDLILGGVGVRRGRHHPSEVKLGDTIDWWRVEAFEPDRLLRLKAEMKVPGRAWLEFEVKEAAGGSIVTQTAIFDPVGLFGLVYWYGVYPLHSLVFKGMLDGVVKSGMGDTP